MSSHPPPPLPARSGWGARGRRLDALVDPAIGVAAAAFALSVFLTADLGELDPRLRGPNVLAATATVVAAGSLAWRRRRPRLAYGLFVVGALVVSGSFHYIASLSLLMLFSLYSLTTSASRRAGAVGLGVGIACFVGLALAGVPDLRIRDVWQSVALLVAAWAVGEVVRTRREWHRDQVRVAITEERLRIARELHDVVAHSMSLIAVQAGVGAHLIRTDPASAGQALEIIAEASRKALGQTRSILGMLREEDDSSVRPPTQGLDELPALVEDVRVAGLDVDLASSGTARTLNAAVSLAAYRIVQESLTNVLKHSAASTATVKVTFTQHQLDVDVCDPGPGRTTAVIGSGGKRLVGHGLIGLDERVRLVGGALAYGARGNGFRVHATLTTGALR